jgi:hypothetical protein
LKVSKNDGVIKLSGEWNSQTQNCNPGKIELSLQSK